MSEQHLAPVYNWTLVVWVPGGQGNQPPGTVVFWDFNIEEAARTAQTWLIAQGCQCLVIKDTT